MNTKIKIGIAGAIVAALIALIVLDQNSTPRDPQPATTESSAGTAGTGNNAFTFAPPLPPPDATTVEGDVDTFMRELEIGSAPSGGEPPLVVPPISEPEQPSIIEVPSEPLPPPVEAPTAPSPSKEYVIQQGDTYENIAKKEYGDGRMWAVIAEANPNMPPTRMRVGKKIMIPAKAAPAASAPSTPEFTPGALQPDRTYVVKAGDTLSGISSKVYNTVRHTGKIFDANRDVIGDPNFLVVGTKLFMPDLAVRPPSSNEASQPGSGTTAVSAPPGSKIHEVRPNESLWKIAERYAGDRGVLPMIRQIVSANSDKLASDASLLRVGWKLVIPE